MSVINSSISHPRLTRGSYTSYFTLQISNMESYTSCFTLQIRSARVQSSVQSARTVSASVGRTGTVGER